MLPSGARPRASRPCAQPPLALLTPARVPAQFPFALPQVPEFRDITGTQGVDQYALNYHDYCHGDGSATQITADSLEALGIDARSENPLLPNAAILRGAEAVDAILNAADSGSPDVPNSMNAGRILCSSATPMRLQPLLQPRALHTAPVAPRACAVCQLGGLIYFTLLGIIVLVLINFLPLVNLISQLMFDGCVACVDAATAKKKPGKARRPASLSKAPSKRVKGTASTASGAADVSNVHLTAQQVRAVKRAAWRENAPTGESLGERLRRLGRTVTNLGATQERAQLLPQHDAVSPPVPAETWA